MNAMEKNIGKNIKEVRKMKKLSQEKLSGKCGISNTTLSAYENSRKIPNIQTIGRIARALGVSIDRLCYGDENNSFIESEPDVGKKIVNSIYLLWSMDIVSCLYNSNIGFTHEASNPIGYYLYINKHCGPIKRLIKSLDEFRINKDTFPEPDSYLEMLKSSVAIEINNEIELMNKQTRKKRNQ